MTDARRQAFLTSLQAGNWITAQWKGGDLSGYLSFSLKGVLRVREAEVIELRKAGIIVMVTRDEYRSRFKTIPRWTTYKLAPIEERIK